jgi:prolipoprotein diacylglyceryltransferase
MSICQLADQLHLPCLLEASLGHMMQRLGCLEDHEIWGDLTPVTKHQPKQLTKYVPDPTWIEEDQSQFPLLWKALKKEETDVNVPAAKPR